MGRSGEAGGEDVEAAGAVVAEAGYGGTRFVEGFFDGGACLAEEFVSEADELFQGCFGEVVCRRYGEVVVADVLRGDAGAGVSLGDACEPFGRSGLSEQLCADDAVSQVRLVAVAVYAGGVGAHDADVVEHGGGGDVAVVERQVSAVCYVECFLRD